ncbi:hypothetical protein [Actinobaculum suis]|uniref:hypothetical protein n=1 Tax=Actinobaculum suis TaxID=1657 RepID=UPI0008086870|nr:hypothetical protein [Actinobaculum suis]OCA93462.1 hypothetical protein ACU20_01215 [Actinobaculum suis]OCA95253.1 hypothetical protein ACU21_04700 [Actinobaculum suis]
MAIFEDIADLFFPRWCAGCGAEDETLCLACQESFMGGPIRATERAPYLMRVEANGDIAERFPVFAAAEYTGRARRAIIRWKNTNDSRLHAAMVAVFAGICQRHLPKFLAEMKLAPRPGSGRADTPAGNVAEPVGQFTTGPADLALADPALADLALADPALADLALADPALAAPAPASANPAGPILFMPAPSRWRRTFEGRFVAGLLAEAATQSAKTLAVSAASCQVLAQSQLLARTRRKTQTVPHAQTQLPSQTQVSAQSRILPGPVTALQRGPAMKWGRLAEAIPALFAASSARGPQSVGRRGAKARNIYVRENHLARLSLKLAGKQDTPKKSGRYGVVLIDDVVTTGATLAGCADALETYRNTPHLKLEVVGAITLAVAPDPRRQKYFHGQQPT